MAPQEKLLTPRDVAGILGCSPDQVIQLARVGQIRVAEPGRFWRFHHTDVMEYRERAFGASEK
jgi:excisionase family DNA binding protein